MTQHVDLHRRRIADKSERPQQPAARLILGLGQLAHVDPPGRCIDAHFQFGTALDGRQTRLVGHLLGRHDRQRESAGLLRRQRLLEIDRQANATALGLGQQHVPAALPIDDPAAILL